MENEQNSLHYVQFSAKIDRDSKRHNTRVLLKLKFIRKKRHSLINMVRTDKRTNRKESSKKRGEVTRFFAHSDTAANNTCANNLQKFDFFG